MSETSERVALVTGGSRGIGAATAKQLAQDGLSVVITYSASPNAAEEVVASIRAKGGKAEAVRADAFHPEQVDRVVQEVAERFGRLDVLVNNAGVLAVAPIDQMDDEQYYRQFRVNVDSVFVAMRAAARVMKPGGRIINIGSTLAERTPMAGISVYTATKTAVVGLTRGAARDLGPKEITVNCVQPGPIHTDMNPATAEGSDYQKSLTALGRYGSPEDIARAVSFLATPGAGNITGAVLTVDGGFAA